MTFMRLVLVLAFSAAVSGAALPTSKPEDVGFSAKRLERIAPLVKAPIDACRLHRAGVSRPSSRLEPGAYFFNTCRSSICRRTTAP